MVIVASLAKELATSATSTIPLLFLSYTDFSISPAPVPLVPFHTLKVVVVPSVKVIVYVSAVPGAPVPSVRSTLVMPLPCSPRAYVKFSTGSCTVPVIVTSGAVPSTTSPTENSGVGATGSTRLRTGYSALPVISASACSPVVTLPIVIEGVVPVSPFSPFGNVKFSTGSCTVPLIVTSGAAPSITSPIVNSGVGATGNTIFSTGFSAVPVTSTSGFAPVVTSPTEKEGVTPMSPFSPFAYVKLSTGFSGVPLIVTPGASPSVTVPIFISGVGAIGSTRFYTGSSSVPVIVTLGAAPVVTLPIENTGVLPNCPGGRIKFK